MRYTIIHVFTSRNAVVKLLKTYFDIIAIAMAENNNMHLKIHEIRTQSRPKNYHQFPLCKKKTKTKNGNSHIVFNLVACCTAMYSNFLQM